eukprot:CAMPEP_0178991408 /NCGR_PEP_ID=MMETSP0795-20121207/5510_1 /TAXON_ID=88552 /ORGANISM="Amoebophrya sp., Strain Ameob2" /LENGTH=130 /DNA_ID=CAMNT_0020683111 /DNA_START=300 /DNA_END=692 /DNA_ORIENTATION=+
MRPIAISSCSSRIWSPALLMSNPTPGGGFATGTAARSQVALSTSIGRELADAAEAVSPCPGTEASASGRALEVDDEELLELLLEEAPAAPPPLVFSRSKGPELDVAAAFIDAVFTTLDIELLPLAISAAN